MAIDAFSAREAERILRAWRTCNRVTIYLVEGLPPELWPLAIPGSPRRSIRSVCAHLHNCRCMWIKTAGKRDGLRSPASVHRDTVTQSACCRALEQSGRAIERLLAATLERAGNVGGFGLDAEHFLAYHAAHEGHHRGQICLVARQLGHRLPADIQHGLWQWSRRSKEAAR